MSKYNVVNSPVLYPETVTTRNGVKVLDTHVNLKWVLDHFKGVVRNNLMKRRWEVELPSEHFIFFEDKENSAIARARYLAEVNHFPRATLTSIGQHIKMLAEENSYHPICDCIIEKPWDGVTRIDDFIATLVSNDPEFTRMVVKTWMCAAVAAIFSPKGFVCHGVLVLQGGQGIGKTGWIKNLDPINCGAVSEGTHLDPTNKDDKARAGEHWIVELGELDSTFKKDIARLKAYITSSSDHIRNPYAVKASHYYRRTVFAASVNSDTYLVDETGNRRWWTVPIVSVDWEKKFDMQQIWSEVYALWRQGHPTELSKTDQKIVDDNNLRFEKVDPIKEKLLVHYDWAAISTRELTTTQVMEEMGYSKATRADLTHCGKLLKQITNNKGRLLQGIWRHPIPVFRPHGFD